MESNGRYDVDVYVGNGEWITVASFASLDEARLDASEQRRFAPNLGIRIWRVDDADEQLVESHKGSDVMAERLYDAVLTALETLTDHLFQHGLVPPDDPRLAEIYALLLKLYDLHDQETT